MDILLLTLPCFFCSLLLFFGVVVGILYRDRRKHTDAWSELAQRAGLTFNAPGWILGRPTLTGSWHGRAVRIYTRTSRLSDNGSDSSAYMQMDMAINLPQGTQFKVSERNLFNRPGKQDVKSGDPEFDQRFIVRGQPPETIRQLLLHGGLRRLLLQARYLNLETTGGQLRYRQPNVETNVETMLFLLSLLFDLAEAIQRA